MGWFSFTFDHFLRNIRNRLRNATGSPKYDRKLSFAKSRYLKSRDLMCRMHGFGSLLYLLTIGGAPGMDSGTVPVVSDNVWLYFIANRSSGYRKKQIWCVACLVNFHIWPFPAGHPEPVSDHYRFRYVLRIFSCLLFIRISKKPPFAMWHAWVWLTFTLGHLQRDIWNRFWNTLLNYFFLLLKYSFRWPVYVRIRHISAQCSIQASGSDIFLLNVQRGWKSLYLYKKKLVFDQ